ncbi:DUF2256 domain-containing protein [Patescibacteria group bacterium]|nr:DUF2256 domain-containing protein [Patescibacteria group bacterium]
MPKKLTETKLCVACKLPFSNRKRWSSRKQWDEVRFCSERCRKAK